MPLFRFLPLMCMIEAALSGRLPLCLQPSGPGRVENCLCPLAGPTVINSLYPDSAGVERLVVIMYRKIESDEITIFIPQNEVQNEIPDFPEEYGTIHYNFDSNNRIVDLFNKGPITIRQQPAPIITQPKEMLHDGNDANQVVIIVDVKGSKGLNLVHGSQQEHLNENMNPPPWLIPVSNNYDNLRPTQNNLIPQLHPEINEIETMGIPEANVEHYEDNVAYSSIVDYPINTAPENPIEHSSSYEQYAVPQRPSMEIENQSDFYEEAHEPSEADYLEYKVKEVSSESSNPDIQVNPLNPNKIPIISEDRLNTNGEEMNVISPSDVSIKVQRIRVPRKDRYGRIIGWTYQIIKRYFVNDGKTQYLVRPHNDMSYFNDDRNRQYESVPSFDYWLQEQLKYSASNGNNMPTDADDITALHIAIRNVLLQNGLIVTKQGTVIDGHGITSSLDNLKLRPILIGKSISYNRFLNDIGTSKPIIPSNTPVLEGLLLTMINPPKILGIVPLSRTKNENVEVSHGNRIQPVGPRGSLKVLPISQLVQFRKDSPKGKASITTKQHLGSIVTSLPNSIQSKKESKFPPQALKDIPKPQREEGRTKDRHLVPVTSKDSGTSEEVPDFRIIGGNSATVSGTPLLVRGRSGLDFEYI